MCDNNEKDNETGKDKHKIHNTKTQDKNREGKRRQGKV